MMEIEQKITLSSQVTKMQKTMSRRYVEYDKVTEACVSIAYILHDKSTHPFVLNSFRSSICST